MLPHVTAPIPTPGGRKLVAADIPGGEMAVVLHDGPYDTVDVTYAAIGTWIAESGYHIAGPPQEAYLREPTGKLTPLDGDPLPGHQRLRAGRLRTRLPGN